MNRQIQTMQVGIDSFATAFTNNAAGVAGSASDALRYLVDRIVQAEQVGLDVFGIVEHHRKEFLDSAPPVILAAAAARTNRIRLTSAVTVLSAADPVRVFQQFSTLDLLSQGRAEMVVGRGSFIESFPLFGLELKDYDSLFEEKLDLLLNIRENEQVHWSGKHRASLTGQGVYPRPVQNPLPIWLGVGGTPESFARAGALGLPLMVAIIGGETRRFRPLVDLYRKMGQQAGFAPEQLKVGVHALGYVADTTEQAVEDFFPGYSLLVSVIGNSGNFPEFSVFTEDGWKLIHVMAPSDEVICASCRQNNRLPQKHRFLVARCGECHGYLAWSVEQSQLFQMMATAIP
jgi:probable LLM family oxidoreductase